MAGERTTRPPVSPYAPYSYDYQPKRSAWRSPKVLIPVVVGVVLVLLAAAAVVVYKVRHAPVIPEAPPSNTPAAASSLPAGRTWLSGAWTGTTIGTKLIDGFGTWRGQPADSVTTYPGYDTWNEIADTDWHISVLNGFKGRLEYGLPIVPDDGSSTLKDVVSGDHDAVFVKVAQLLNKHDRGDSFVRIGLEANGTWFPWGATAQTASDYKAAWRHVQGIMKKVSPKLTFVFDITCARGLDGSNDRMASLTDLYPGDDVVDIVGCDHYDSYTVKSRNASEWQDALHPDSAGLADVATFARAHHKGLAVPEWGLTSTAKDGAGDNPYFIYSMYRYFQQNKDILVFENYFNEPDKSLGSAIWNSDENPRSAAEYKKLWGAAPTLTQATS
jgi:hypothetical protein